MMGEVMAVDVSLVPTPFGFGPTPAILVFSRPDSTPMRKNLSPKDSRQT
jgi:hypothetical protein